MTSISSKCLTKLRKSIRRSIIFLCFFFLSIHYVYLVTAVFNLSMYFYRGYRLRCYRTYLNVNLLLKNNSFRTDQLTPGRTYTFSLRGYTNIGGSIRTGREASLTITALPGR